MGGAREVKSGQVPDPHCPVAEHYELLGLVRPAPTGLGIDQGPEVLDWFEGGDVARRARVADREALFVHGGLGEGHRELDLPGMSPAVGAPTGPAFGASRYCGHPSAIERHVQLFNRGGGAERHQLATCQRGGFNVAGFTARPPVGFGAAFHALGRQGHPGELGE